VLVGLISS